MKYLTLTASLLLMSCGPALELQKFSAASGKGAGEQQEFQVEDKI